MFTELREASGETASTPEYWARNFKNSQRLNWRTRLSIRHDFRLKLIRRYIPSGRILDAGCGFGEWVSYLAQVGYAAEGLDYSPELIARLNATYPQNRWTQGTTQRMPYPEASFDGLISWGVIEHDQQGPAAQLREFARVLKPSGAAVITVPADTRRMRNASQLQFSGSGSFFQYFMTHAELQSACESAGLRIAALGDIPENVPALLAPRWYAQGHAGMRIVNVARRLLPRIPGMHGMIYAIAVR